MKLKSYDKEYICNDFCQPREDGNQNQERQISYCSFDKVVNLQ